MAFEVDAIDQSWQEGWSVVVHGHAQLLHDDAEIAELGQHLAQSWVPAERAYHIKIVPDSITGRSIDIGRARAATSRPGPEHAAAAGQGPARTRDRQPGQR